MLGPMYVSIREYSSYAQVNTALKDLISTARYSNDLFEEKMNQSVINHNK